MDQGKLTVGTRVQFLTGPLGASRRNDLSHVVHEVFGMGDEGLVSFPHPNPKACSEWVYVEVDSKNEPGEKLYVGVTPKMVAYRDALPASAVALLWLCRDDSQPVLLSKGDSRVLSELALRGLCEARRPAEFGHSPTYRLTDAGRVMVRMST